MVRRVGPGATKSGSTESKEKPSTGWLIVGLGWRIYLATHFGQWLVLWGRSVWHSLPPKLRTCVSPFAPAGHLSSVLHPGCVAVSTQDGARVCGGESETSGRPRTQDHGQNGSLLGEEIYPTPPTCLGHLCQSEQNWYILESITLAGMVKV